MSDKRRVSTLLPSSQRTPDSALETQQELINSPLLERCRSGDTAAFDEVVAQHQDYVYNLCFWLLGDCEDATDAAQETFIRAFRGLSKFRGECSFATWLHRIASNTACDFLKRRRRAPLPFSTLEDCDAVEASAHAATPHQIFENPQDVQDVVTQRERQQLVRQALAKLPEEQRLVVVLFDLQGHSYEEIAALLELPLGTVKSRLNRARLALRDALAAHRELF